MVHKPSATRVPYSASLRNVFPAITLHSRCQRRERDLSATACFHDLRQPRDSCSITQGSFIFLFGFFVWHYVLKHFPLSQCSSLFFCPSKANVIAMSISLHLLSTFFPLPPKLIPLSCILYHLLLVPLPPFLPQSPFPPLLYPFLNHLFFLLRYFTREYATVSPSPAACPGLENVSV